MFCFTLKKKGNLVIIDPVAHNPLEYCKSQTKHTE